MSANCCTRVYLLGCFPSGPAQIELGFDALKTGTYRAVFKYLDREIVFEEPFTVGDPLVFGVRNLNDHFAFEFYITDPDGDRVENVVDGVTYDCWRVDFNASAIGDPYTPPSDGETCLLDIVISLDGEEQETLTDIDPCEDQTINITLL